MKNRKAGLWFLVLLLLPLAIWLNMQGCQTQPLGPITAEQITTIKPVYATFKVVEEGTNNPLQGVQVTFSDDSFITDAGGYFYITKKYPQAAYSLTLTKTGYVTIQRDVTFNQDEKTTQL